MYDMDAKFEEKNGGLFCSVAKIADVIVKQKKKISNHFEIYIYQMPIYIKYYFMCTLKNIIYINN